MNKNEFLNTLYHYRDRLKDEHTSPGWNKWALFGSLSALIWLLLELLKENSINLTSGMPLLFILILVNSPIRSIISLVGSQKPNSKTVYSSIRQEISENFFSISLTILSMGFIMFYSHYNLHLPVVQSASLNIYIGIQLIMYLFILLISRFDTHGPDLTAPNKFIRNIKRISIAILWLLAMLSIWGLATTIKDWRNYSMWQSALLCYGIFFILQKIIEDLEGYPLLDSINDLVDDVTFDKITLEEAEKNLRVIWLGTEFKDIIAPLFANFIAVNDRFQKLVSKTKERCEQYFEVAMELRPALEESIKANVEEVKSAQKDVEVTIKKIKIKLAFFYLLEKESQNYKEIPIRMNELLAQSDSLVADLKSFVAEREKGS